MSSPDKTPEPDKMHLQNLSANILLNGERLNDIFFKRSETPPPTHTHKDQKQDSKISPLYSIL